jgi:positive regulator of sigma E activity
MTKSPVYINTGDFESRIIQMKNKILFYSVFIIAMVLLFVVQGYLTYNLAKCLHEKELSKIITKILFIVLNSTVIVKLYSRFLEKSKIIVVE